MINLLAIKLKEEENIKIKDTRRRYVSLNLLIDFVISKTNRKKY